MLWRVLLALLLGIPLFGQSSFNSRYNITQFTTKDGLISNACHDVVTDDEGFVWVAMDGGLMRFDGSNFVAFGEEIGLDNQTIIHLRKVSNGSLWMHTVRGDVLIKPHDSDRVKYANFNDSLKSILTKTIGFSKDIFCISHDQKVYLENYGNDEMIVFDTMGYFERIESDLDSKGFIVVELNDGQVIPVATSKQNFVYKNVLKSNEHKIPIINKTGFSTGDQILEVRFDSLSFYVLLKDVSLESKKLVTCLSRDTFLIQTNNIISIFTRNELLASLRSDLILDVQRISDGSFLFGYKREGGLRRFKNVNAIIENQYSQLLEGYSITSISQEVKNEFWVSTLEGGIFNFHKNIVDKVVDIDDLRFIEYGGDSSVIIADLKTIWKFNPITYNKTLLWEPENELRDITVVDTYKRLVVAGLPSIILDLENPGKSYNLYRYSPRQIQQGDMRISPIQAGLKKIKYFNNDHLIGVSGTYLVQYNNGDSIPYFSSNIEGKITYLRINDIQEFSDTLVMASDTGLVRYENNEILPFKFHGSIIKEKVTELDKLGERLVITIKSKGFYVLGSNGDLNVNYLGASMPANYINQIVTDNSYLFVCSDKGVGIFKDEQDSLVMQYFLSVADGLSSEEVFDVCVIQDHLFIVTSNGIDQLKFKDLIERKGRVIIEYINKQLVSDRNIKYEIAPDEDVIIDFTSPRRVNEVFRNNRYRINGSDWIYSLSNEIRFSSLKAGEYTLEICVQDNNGRWNSCEIIEFRKLQMWYRTPEFIILFLLVCFWSITYYFRSRFKKQELQREIDLQIIDLERKALNAQMNPHFIFNVLNSIQNYIYFNDRKSAMKFLSKFAGLVRKSLNASAQSYITLEEDMDLIMSYLELEEVRNNNRFSFHVECSCKYNQSSILVPPMLVQPFVENSVFHGMKEIEKGGMIEVFYNVSDDFVEVIIKDNGTGFGESDLDKKDSYGINLTRQRLGLINKKGTPAMTIDNNEGPGTTVKIYISYRFIERS